MRARRDIEHGGRVVTLELDVRPTWGVIVRAVDETGQAVEPSALGLSAERIDKLAASIYADECGN